MARKSRQFQVPPADLVDTLDGFVAGRQSLAEVRDRLRRTLAADPQQSVLLTLCVERARDDGRLGLAAADALLVLAAGTASEDIPTAGPEVAAAPRTPVPAEPPEAPTPAAPAKPAATPAAATGPAATSPPPPTPAPAPAQGKMPATGRRARGSASTGDDRPPPSPSPSPSPAQAQAHSHAPTWATAAPPRALARHRAGLRPGTVLKDRYVLGDRLGGGGMAEIYKALDRRREQAGTRPHWVALKVVASADDRSPAAEALQREASLAARLDHPNIVRVFGLDRDGSHLFLAMELLAGESLAHRLDRRQQRPLPRLQVVPLIEALCRALAYLHGRGLVHGDIKPGNLFITADEQVKILDFGIARDLQAATPVTPRGRTAEYASCEVLAGEPPVPADDVYSVACVAYRMLAGHRPFGNQTAREAEVAGRRPAVIETLPAAQWQALERALSFRRAERPADLGQFIALFKGSRDEVEPPAPVAASAPPAATSEPPSQPPSQRWPFAGTWAAFVAICALGAAVVWVVPRHMPRQSTNPAPRQLLPPAPDPGAPAVAPQPAPPYDPVPAATDGAPAPRLVLPADEVPTDEG